MRVGHADIDIEVEIAEDPMPAQFDRRLISQALTNIIKNATEAIAAVPPAELGRGRIQVVGRARGRRHRDRRRSTTASACRRRTAAACSSPM